METNIDQLLKSITTSIQAQEYQAALKLLEAHLDILEIQLDRFTLLNLLAEFPDELPINPLFLKGQLLAQEGRYQEASHVLHHAKTLALQKQLLTQAIKCCLALASLYQRHEDFQTALYHIQEAESISVHIIDQEAKANLLLSLAELCPDVGQLNKSIQYATEALQIFSLAGNSEGQFQALYLLAIVNRQLGEYDAASSRLEMARQCQKAEQLSSSHFARILSGEAHLLWYQGRLKEAISKAQIFRQLSRLEKLDKQHVYAHILLGNLYRALNQYKEAEQFYIETADLVSYYNLPLYLPWIDIQRGWLKVLTGDLNQARRYIHSALQTDNKGLQMSFNVNLAGLELLTGQHRSAENLLQSSRQFYVRSGDLLSYHVINLYLAHLYWQQEQQSESLPYLRQALEWFTEHNITYFPNWWHPQIVTEVCVIALAEQICTPLVERIFLTHLQQHESLLTLRQHSNQTVRQHALNLYQLLASNSIDVLSEVSDHSVKSVLQELLQNGPLREDTFARLQQKLVTAKHRNKINPTCTAVFGLYLQGLTRQEIARKLDCSPATVRNYITTAYQAFHLPLATGEGTLARKEKLRQLAQAEGLIRKAN